MGRTLGYLKSVRASASFALFLFGCLVCAVPGCASDFRAPAGERYAEVGASGSILPGGRFLKPFGLQIETGPGTFGLAVSPGGIVATVDIGSEMPGIAVIERGQDRARHIWAESAGAGWKAVASGIVFESEQSIWVSEGESGRVRQIDIATGATRRTIDLNDGERKNSVTGDLAYDAIRHLLYVVDRHNARLAAIDTRSGRAVSSARLCSALLVSGMPFAVALSPDGFTAYVTEPDAVCAIDVHDPLKPAVLDRMPAASPQGVLAAGDRVYVSNAFDDSITVFSAADRKAISRIALWLPSLDRFRGVLPAGMAYDPAAKRLLVAEAGINAVGVVDTTKNQLIGLIPAGWMPIRVAEAGGRVYVANALGKGTGPNPRRDILELGETYLLHRGSVSTFPMPDTAELARQTASVFSCDGFFPIQSDASKPPAEIRHVVLIVKEGRTFDEVLGDVDKAGNGPVLSLTDIARFGNRTVAHGGRGKFSVQDVALTPSQHEIARRWAFSDNFYSDGETTAEGNVWLNGGYPDIPAQAAILSSQPISAATKLWEHLQRGGVTFRDFEDEPHGGDTSDQLRADRAIAEIDRRYAKGGEPFPQFVRIRLPNDRIGNPAFQPGYPFEASFVLDNDFATGRIVEYLSHSPWWRDMAIFVTESGTQDGAHQSLDHVDAARTLLLLASPYAKRNYVSHTNAGFPALLRTIFELLRLQPLNLADATAASLRDMFTTQPDFEAFTAVPPDARVFDPVNAH